MSCFMNTDSLKHKYENQIIKYFSFININIIQVFF